MHPITRTALAMALAIGLVACQDPGARTAEEQANVAAVQAQTEAFNAQEPGFVERFHGEDLIYQSYGPWAPQGMTGDLEQMKAGVAAGMRMFPDRRMTVKSLVAEGDTVVMETEWAGTATAEHPTLQKGERQVLRDINFNRFRDGKVVEVREYAVVVSAAPAQAEETSSRTPQEQANEAAARRWVELFNAGTRDWWDQVHAPDVTWEAYSPGYQSASGDALKALRTQALEVFPDRAFELLSLSADGERVIIEAIWTGTAAKPGLRFKPGDRRTARYVIFQTYRDGKITAIRNYVAETIDEASG